MRNWILLFAIVFGVTVLCGAGHTQVKRTLESRVAMLEDHIVGLEGRVAALQRSVEAMNSYGVGGSDLSGTSSDRVRVSEKRRLEFMEREKEKIEQRKDERVQRYAYTRNQSLSGMGSYCY